MLVVVCGPPGVGKTTVGREIADRIDADVLRTDVVRKDLFPDPEYTDEERRRVYGELLDRARTRLADGRSVVLDGTFREERRRGDAAEMAGGVGADCRFVRVECDPAVAKERIRGREGDESDAEVEDYRRFREAFDPLTREHVTIDNSGDPAATREQIARHF